jgi:hypothetical protein
VRLDDVVAVGGYQMPMLVVGRQLPATLQGTCCQLAARHPATAATI